GRPLVRAHDSTYLHQFAESATVARAPSTPGKDPGKEPPRRSASAAGPSLASRDELAHRTNRRSLSSSTLRLLLCPAASASHASYLSACALSASRFHERRVRSLEPDRSRDGARVVFRRSRRTPAPAQRRFIDAFSVHRSTFEHGRTRGPGLLRLLGG